MHIKLNQFKANMLIIQMHTFLFDSLPRCIFLLHSSTIFLQACILRTCNCGTNLVQCLCVALGNYAKACASLGVELGDWRKATNCCKHLKMQICFPFTAHDL